MADRIKIYPESHGRAPLIALDYDQRQLAQPKELMIDYSNQDLYVVDKNDSSTFYNLTTILTTKVSSNIDASKIYITLDNIGTVRLKTYLEEMSSKNIKVDGLEHGINFLNTAFDNKSIECLDGLVQVASFDTATNGQVAVKEDDYIKWITIGEFTECKWGRIAGNIADQTDLQTTLSTKQDKLTAGTGIEITDTNTINCTQSGGNIDDVKVNGVSVVTDKIANIDLSGKQDKLTAGTGITISADGTISVSIPRAESEEY